MRSYGLHIDGQDLEGRGWTYAVRASAFLRDPERAFNLKRSLELGECPQDVDDDVFGRCAWGDDEHNRLALEAARRASPAFSALPLETRRAIVDDFYQAMLARADEFVELLVAEGHPRRLAEWETSGVLRGCDPETVAWYYDQMRSEYRMGDRRLELTRKPDGVVCVNPPQNAAGSNGAMGGLALLGGNTLVVKAPRTTPTSVMFLYRDLIVPIVERHGGPPGTVNLISGDSRSIVGRWVKSPLVDDVLFFGDSSTGLKIGQDCVAHGKKPILELSGNDGFVVWRDADLDAAALALSECFYGSSQICMVPKYAIVHPEVADELLDRLLTTVAGIRPGFPEDPDVLLSPVLKADRYFDFLAEARERGCDVLTGGRRVGVDGEASDFGLFLEPTVVRVDGLAAADELSCVREETFFPLLPVVVPSAGDDRELLEELLTFLEGNEYGLRNSVWATDPVILDTFASRLRNGGLLKINDSHIGFVSYLSTHGGTGRTGGPHGELNFVALRTTHLQGICWGTGNPEPFEPRTQELAGAT